MKIKKMVLISILAAIITVSGMFKIPSPIAGGEFQMSAPIAVTIAMLFGFKVYLIAGIVSSIASLMMGTATFYSVVIAMTFRIVVGLVVYFIGANKISVIISGPLGTATARFVLSLIMKVNFFALLIGAVPGMIFTMITSYIIYSQMYKIMKKTYYREYIFKNEVLEV